MMSKENDGPVVYALAKFADVPSASYRAGQKDVITKHMGEIPLKLLE